MAPPSAHSNPTSRTSLGPLLPLLAIAGSVAAAPRPHILLLMADQLRWDVVNPTCTPHLPALAANGLTAAKAVIGDHENVTQEARK